MMLTITIRFETPKKFLKQQSYSTTNKKTNKTTSKKKRALSMAAASSVHSHGGARSEFGRMRSSGSKRHREGWLWCEGRVGSENAPAELRPKPSREPVDDFDFDALEENGMTGSAREGKVKCFLSEQEPEGVASTFSLGSRDRENSPSARNTIVSGNFTTVLEQQRQALSDAVTADRRPCFVPVRESGGARGDAEIRADAREVTAGHIDSAPDEAAVAAAMQRILGSFTGTLLQHPTPSLSRERSFVDGSRSRRSQCPTPLFGTPPTNYKTYSPSSFSARNVGGQSSRACAHCGKSFSTESNLRRHMVSKHAHDTNAQTLLAAAAALVGNRTEVGVASPSLHVSPVLLPKMTSITATFQPDSSRSYDSCSSSYRASVSPLLNPAISSHVESQQTCSRPLSNFQKSLQNACVTQLAIRANGASSSRSPYTCIIQHMNGGSGDSSGQHSTAQPTATCSGSERKGSFSRTTNGGSHAPFSFVHEVQANQWKCASVYSEAGAAVYQDHGRERAGNFANHLPRPTYEEESPRGLFNGDLEPMTGVGCVKDPLPPHFHLSSCLDSCLTVSGVNRGRAPRADEEFYGEDGPCHDSFMVSTTAPNLSTAIAVEPQNAGRVDRNSFEGVPVDGHDDRLSSHALCASFALFVDDDSAAPPKFSDPSDDNQSGKGGCPYTSTQIASDGGLYGEGMHAFRLTTFMDSETDLPRDMSPPLPTCTSSNCTPYSFANENHSIAPIISNLESVRGTLNGLGESANWLGGLLSPSLSSSPNHRERHILPKAEDTCGHNLTVSQSEPWATNDVDFHAAHFSSSCLHSTTVYEQATGSATPLAGLSVGLMTILDQVCSNGTKMNANGRSSSDRCGTEVVHVVDVLNASFTDIEDVKRLL